MARTVSPAIRPIFQRTCSGIYLYANFPPGADPRQKNFYLRVKGEVEQEISKVGFKRLDILRPGLLRGSRENDLRPGELLARMASPVVDPLIPNKWAMFKSVDADLVAEAALGLSLRRAAGRFTHDNEAMKRAAREWRAKEPEAAQ